MNRNRINILALTMLGMLIIVSIAPLLADPLTDCMKERADAILTEFRYPTDDELAQIETDCRKQLSTSNISGDDTILIHGLDQENDPFNGNDTSVGIDSLDQITGSNATTTHHTDKPIHLPGGDLMDCQDCVECLTKKYRAHKEMFGTDPSQDVFDNMLADCYEQIHGKKLIICPTCSERIIIPSYTPQPNDGK